MGPRGWGVGTNAIVANVNPNGGLSWDDTRMKTYQPWNVMSTWNFVYNIPREWGLVGPGAKLDFSKEVRIDMPDGQVSWSVALGTSDINKYSVADEGYHLVDYAQIATNVILQAANTAVAPAW